MSSDHRQARVPAVIVLAGVAAAIHVGKLPPAVLALQQALGVTLVQAGFLLSLVQFGGMALGLVAGLLAESLGLRRSMLTGLALLTLAGCVGVAAQDVFALLVLRIVESVGLLMVAVPAPSLLRRTVDGHGLTRWLGIWGAYMPFGMALALLVGPFVIGWLGWRPWWVLTACATGIMFVAALRVIPPDRHAGFAQPAPAENGSRRAPGRVGAPEQQNWRARLLLTLRAGGPWLGALAFGVYALQWLALIGFLPALYERLGWSGVQVALATAAVTAINVVGNIAAGYLLQRGARARSLLWIGFAATGVGSSLAFVAAATLPAVSVAGAFLFSVAGGLIPGALFGIVPRLAPSDDTIATTVGWIQQWSSTGQVSGPPLVAWVASMSGGSFAPSWIVMTTCSVAGIVLAWQIGYRLART